MTKSEQITAQETAEQSADALVWSLHLAHYDREWVEPVRCQIIRGQSVALNRSSQPFASVLARDDRVSRRHARVLVDSTGALFVADDGSRNGVFVNGEPIAHAMLQSGDVVRVGGSLFVVSRAAYGYPIAPDSDLPGVSGVIAALRTRIVNVALAAPIVVVCAGPGGMTGAVGCSLRTHAGRTGELRSVSLASLKSAADWTVRADDVLFVRGADAAPRAALERLVDRTTAASRDRRVRYVLSWRLQDGQRAPADPLLDSVFAHPSVARIDVPPMRAHMEDLPSRLMQYARARGIAPQPMGHAVITRLLRASWPGNEAQFEAVADELLAGRGELDLESLLRDSWTSSAEAGEIDSGSSLTSTGGAGFTIAGTGRWFRDPGGRRVDMQNRPVLTRLLAALARGYVEDPRRALDLEALIGTAWPGVRFVEDSAASRLYVALSALRRLGLRDVIVREESGYRLHDRRGVLIVDDDR